MIGDCLRESDIEPAIGCGHAHIVAPAQSGKRESCSYQHPQWPYGCTDLDATLAGGP